MAWKVRRSFWTGISRNNPIKGFFGQQVVSTTGEGERLTVDLSGLPAGVYFVNITDKEGRKCVRKVMKE